MISTLNRPLGYFEYLYLNNGYRNRLQEFFEIDKEIEDFYEIDKINRFIKSEDTDEEGKDYDVYRYFEKEFEALLLVEFNKSKNLFEEKYANCITAEQIGLFFNFQLSKLIEIEEKINTNIIFEDYDLHIRIVEGLRKLIRDKYTSQLINYDAIPKKLIDNIQVEDNDKINTPTSLNITDKPNSTPDESNDNIPKNLQDYTTPENLIFILKMLEDLGVTVNGISKLNKKKKGAIRGIVEALIEFKILPLISLELSCKMIANQIGLELNSKLDYSNIYKEFKKLTREYILENKSK